MDVNKAWARKISKADFIAQLSEYEHLKCVDLGEAWEKAQKPKAEPVNKTSKGK